MTRFKGKICRTTNHNPPRYQIYQPGFNAGNGCWLDGEWIGVNPDDAMSEFAFHSGMYEKLAEEMKAQSHHGDPVPLEKLTPAQRQAWKFYSGQQMLEAVVVDTGEVSPIYVNLCGNTPSHKDIKWLRDNGIQIPRRIKRGEEETDQLEGLVFPDDLVMDAFTDDKGEVADPWQSVVKQNQEREREMFDAMASMASGNIPPEQEEGMTEEDRAVLSRPGMGNFMGMMAFTMLVSEEENIIRDEVHKAQTGNDSYLSDLPEARKRYAEMRQQLKDQFGEQFEAQYQAARKDHNGCARANLDNSDGHLFCYVVPEFHEDGTHEPWGERDIPWNARR